MIFVDSLVIEVTRRCNMDCNHCLRGDAQNMDISYEVLEEIARSVCPQEVTFTGGEPSLNLPAIGKYFELAEKYGTMPKYFYVVTNGKSNAEELAITFLHAYSKMEEPDYCGVALSRDVFHEDIDEKNIRILQGLSFFREEDKFHEPNETYFNWLLNSGKAEEYGIGTRNPNPIGTIGTLFWQTVESRPLRELYVAANGNVIDNCNLSYKDIDMYAFCTIEELGERLNKMNSTDKILIEHLFGQTTQSTHILHVIETDVDGCGGSCDLYAGFDCHLNGEQTEQFGKMLCEAKRLEDTDTQGMVESALEKFESETGIGCRIVDAPIDGIVNF